MTDENDEPAPGTTRIEISGCVFWPGCFVILLLLCAITGFLPRIWATLRLLMTGS